MLTPVLPPTEESTWETMVVGIWTKRDAAVEDGRDEAGEVADHAAAEGDDEGLAVVAGLGERAAQVLELFEALGRLAGGHQVAGGIEAGFVERDHHGLGVVPGDVGVGDQGGPSG